MRALGVPDAADVAERLEAVERNAALGEGLGHRKPAGAGADDAIPRQFVLILLPRPEPGALLARP